MEYNIIGKYNKDCKIFAKTVEEDALKMVYSICDCPAFKDQKIRIMPDIHLGQSITIGFSSTIDKENPMVNPSHVGVDICCQVTCIKMSKPCPEESYALLEHRWKKDIPTGFTIYDKKIADEKMFYKMCNTAIDRAVATTNFVNNVNVNEKYISDMLKRIGMDEGTFWKSLGTTGGGNHFLSYDTDDEGNGYIMIHCGSRNFGLKVAKYWMNVANKPYHVDSSEWAKHIEKIKDTYPKSEWNERIKNAKEDFVSSVPTGYLNGKNLIGYLTDMVIAQTYAKYNHLLISDKMTEIYTKIVKGASMARVINTMHNYIDFDDMIIRKGSVNAAYGRELVIPINMRDGVLICVGKGNTEWNCTAPHGAGRLMSRSAAKANLSMDEFVEEMKDVCSTSVNKSTLDESPMAYKPMDEIIEQIEPTVQILKRIKERINIKAAE